MPPSLIFRLVWNPHGSPSSTPPTTWSRQRGGRLGWCSAIDLSPPPQAIAVHPGAAPPRRPHLPGLFHAPVWVLRREQRLAQHLPACGVNRLPGRQGHLYDGLNILRSQVANRHVELLGHGLSPVSSRGERIVPPLGREITQVSAWRRGRCDSAAGWAFPGRVPSSRMDGLPAETHAKTTREDN